MVSVIDYGIGNLGSVKKAFEFIGEKVEITNDPKKIIKADKVILPGVGAFEYAIKTIKEKHFDEVLREIVDKKTPLLGICLGMQLMFDKSFENGEFKGLSLMPGEIVKLPETEKIPQIGWNDLDIKIKSPLFEGLEEKPYVYFVHSYYLKTDAPVVSATCFYGKEIAVAAQKDNVFALQFHPEKSGETGLKILKNFAKL